MYAAPTPAADGGLHQPRSAIPFLVDLLEEEAHEVSIRRRRMRRKRAVDIASKVRRGRRLAAKEDPYYIDVTTKATWVKAAQLDLTRASARMKYDVEESGVLLRPRPLGSPSPSFSAWVVPAVCTTFRRWRMRWPPLPDVCLMFLYCVCSWILFSFR